MQLVFSINLMTKRTIPGRDKIVLIGVLVDCPAMICQEISTLSEVIKQKIV